MSALLTEARRVGPIVMCTSREKILHIKQANHWFLKETTDKGFFTKTFKCVARPAIIRTKIRTKKKAERVSPIPAFSCEHASSLPRLQFRSFSLGAQGGDRNTQNMWRTRCEPTRRQQAALPVGKTVLVTQARSSCSGRWGPSGYQEDERMRTTIRHMNTADQQRPRARTVGCPKAQR